MRNGDGSIDALAVRMRGIRKRFPGVAAADGVDFDLRRGEIHTLLGENGAGKSTLMQILSGLYRPDAGEIEIDGRPVAIRSPRNALALGIGMLHQHSMLIPRHTVAENAALLMPDLSFLYRAREIERRVAETAQRYGFAVDPGAPPGSSRSASSSGPRSSRSCSGGRVSSSWMSRRRCSPRPRSAPCSP